jgi:hypothetical protein
MEHTDSVTCTPPDDATENDNRDYWVMALVITFMLGMWALAIL